jgi:hypothetical protein
LDSVQKTYNSFINPGEIPVGYAFLETKRAAGTHLIPLPQHGFGGVSDLLEIIPNEKGQRQITAIASIYVPRRY